MPVNGEYNGLFVFEMSTSFGSILREIRKEKGLTITDCAAAVNVTQPAWNQWELGLREPKLDCLVQIANFLSTSTDILLGVKNRSQGISVHAGNGSAVAIGTNAKACSERNVIDCRACPYRKWGEKLRKQGLVIPGVDGK